MYKIVPLILFELLYKIGIPAQSLNPFHILSILLFLKVSRFRLTPISKMLLIFDLYALFITFFNILIVMISGYKDVPFVSVFRQLVGLSISFTTFFVLREIFRYYPDKSLNWLVKVSIIVSVISVFIVDILLNHRFFRVNATFIEPSHFGQFLVFILIPSILLSNIPKTLKKIFIIIVGMLIFLTFSFTTYIRLFIFLFFLFLFHKSITQKIKFLSISILLIILGLWAFLEIFKDSYVTYQLKSAIETIFITGSLETGTASLVDRIQLVFILKNFLQLGVKSIFGVGIGFEPLYFNVLYPENILNTIIQVKQFASYLNSFWGKVISYTGIIGLSIFLYLLKRTIKASAILKEKSFIVQASITAIYTYALIGLAPFQCIELWFWLAFLDGIYLNTIRGVQK